MVVCSAHDLDEVGRVLDLVVSNERLEELNSPDSAKDCQQADTGDLGELDEVCSLEDVKRVSLYLLRVRCFDLLDDPRRVLDVRLD